MSQRLWPVEQERALISVAVIGGDLSSVVTRVAPGDFSKPEHQVTWAAIVEHWRRGGDIDIVGLGETPGGLTGAELAELFAMPSSTSMAPRYAAHIAEAAALRSVSVELSRAQDEIQDPSSDLGARDIVGNFAERANDAMRLDDEDGPVTVAEMRAELDAEPEQYEWLWPDFLRRRWRVIVAGGEGIGKMVLLRQIGLSLAAGIEPFTGRSIDPIRVLVIDVENPAPTIVEQSELVWLDRDAIGAAEDRYQTWSREQGIDVLSSADRRRVEAAVAAAKPDLLIMGPLYKMKRNTGRGYDIDALDTINFFDDLRVRFNCALIIEQHLVADKKSNAALRSVDHADSQHFVRWPEMAFSMIEHPEAIDGERVKLARVRGARNGAMWPPALIKRPRGDTHTGPAWCSWWETGAPSRDGDDEPW